MKNEHALRRAVSAYLKTAPGVWALKVHGGPFQMKGVPDYLCCVRGRFVAIEIKRPDGRGRTSKLQDEIIRRIREAGGVAVVAESLEDVERALS